MLRRVPRWRRSAAVAMASLAGLPLLALGPAAVARADVVRNTEQWVLSDLNIQQAWAVTRGQGITVAVIDSGVDPNVSDLTGSVRTGPNFSGVSTPPSNPNWGTHGTWMASLIAGHGHDGGSSGIIGTAPQSTVLSIRVITDPQDPNYGAYQRESATKGQDELAAAIRYAVSQHAQVISMSLGYNLPSEAVRAALQDAYQHNVVVVASAGNSGDAACAAGDGHAAVFVPGQLPRGTRGRRGQQLESGRHVLQPEPVRPGGRSWLQGAGARAGRTVLVCQRHEPGVRADRRGRRADQGPVPAADRSAGHRRDHQQHDALDPAARRLRRADRVRRGQCRRCPDGRRQVVRRRARRAGAVRREPLRRRPGGHTAGTGLIARRRPAWCCTACSASAGLAIVALATSKLLAPRGVPPGSRAPDAPPDGAQPRGTSGASGYLPAPHADWPPAAGASSAGLVDDAPGDAASGGGGLPVAAPHQHASPAGAGDDGAAARHAAPHGQRHGHGQHEAGPP